MSFLRYTQKAFFIPFLLLLATSVLLFSCFDDNPYLHGKRLYTQHCENCHMDDGLGLQGIIPPLADSDWLQSNPLQTACLIRYGKQDSMMVNGLWYEQPMPAMPQLTAPDITNIVNYINQAWENKFDFVQLPDIEKALDTCE